jgi:hypothetical protein
MYILYNNRCSGHFQNYNRKIIEICQIDTLTHLIHEISLSWLFTGTSIKSGGITLGLCAQTSLPNEILSYVIVNVPTVGHLSFHLLTISICKRYKYNPNAHPSSKLQNDICSVYR